MTLPLPNCDAVVVGDLTGGSVQDSGREITVNAVLRVQRVIKGNIEPGKPGTVHSNPDSQNDRPL